MRMLSTMSFDFPLDEEDRPYFQEVVECLVRYGRRTIPEAYEMVNNYARGRVTQGEDAFWVHEDPYFGGTCILNHRRIVEAGYGWTKDPAFYPRPKELTDRWYGRGASKTSNEIPVQ